MLSYKNQLNSFSIIEKDSVSSVPTDFKVPLNTSSAYNLGSVEENYKVPLSPTEVVMR